jgi:hypothetical protein
MREGGSKRAYWRISKLDGKNGKRFGSCDKILEPLGSRKAKAFCLAILQWMTAKEEVGYEPEVGMGKL